MMDPLEHLKLMRTNGRGGALPRGDLKRIRALRSTEPGFDRAMWREMCGAGWLGLLLPKDAGGSGQGVKVFCEIAQSLGGDLSPEPLIQAAMAALLLPADRLPEVLSGARIILPAWQEAPHSLALSGTVDCREGRLDGRKLCVPMAGGADAFLVTLPDGLALVERTAPGLHIESRPTPDGGNLGTLIFDRTPAEPIPGDAADALEQAIMAHSAYLLGLTERAFAITQESMKAREKTGRQSSLLEAQAQRMKDLQVQVTLTRTAVSGAAKTMDKEKRLAARQSLVSRAKLRATDAALTVTATCAELHLGSGLASTADIDLIRRKAVVLAPLYGSTAVHRARCDALARASAV